MDYKLTIMKFFIILLIIFSCSRPKETPCKLSDFRKISDTVYLKPDSLQVIIVDFWGDYYVGIYQHSDKYLVVTFNECLIY
jgi:hypothetical protein